MPYTFGAGTGDDISFTSNVSIGATSRAALVAGWWLPTTLTATRGLWSAGNTVGAEIDTTTSELRLRTDNTTDGQWTTTGVGLTANQWQFLAFLCWQSNTGPTGNWKVWSGTIDTAPVEVTVTQATAPVGNHTGSTTFYIGNKGTGTLAFQGDIAHVTFCVTNASVVTVASHPFSIGGYATTMPAEITQLNYERYVLPLWRGEYSQLFWHNDLQLATRHCPLNVGATVYGSDNAATGSNVQALATTVNGATWSQNGPPRPHLEPPMLRPRRR